MQLSCIDYLKNQPSWILLLLSVGLLSLLQNLTALLKWIYVTFLRPPQNLKNYGSWALITGPTDGIGKAFAFQFAQRGLNLILVARNYDKLRAVSSAIQDKFPKTQIRFVTVDFYSDLAIEIRRIEEAIEGMDIGVFINNVGITYPAARFFDEVEEEVWMKLIKVNIEGTTRVKRAVLPGMIRRKRGPIVNIGSGSSIVLPSHPLYAIYAATKGKGHMEELQSSRFSGGDDDEFYEKIEAPKFVDFTVSDLSLPDDRSWVCLWAKALIKFLSQQTERKMDTPQWKPVSQTMQSLGYSPPSFREKISAKVSPKERTESRQLPPTIDCRIYSAKFWGDTKVGVPFSRRACNKEDVFGGEIPSRNSF